MSSDKRSSTARVYRRDSIVSRFRNACVKLTGRDSNRFNIEQNSSCKTYLL